MHNSIINWFNENYNTYKSLADIMKFENNIEEVNNNKTLDGLTFVITGSVNHFKNRDELKNKIEELNGKVAGSVSSKTNYLINNDNTSNSSKNKKAAELGIPIITEEEFIAMINR
jgi:DNA ligase (NAD+)